MIHHILFFIPWLGNGGAEKVLLRLVNNLDREKFRISVAVVKSGGSYESALANDINFYSLNSHHYFPLTIRLVLSLIPLRQLIIQEKPDILCSFLDNANIVAVLAKGLIANSPPTVLTVHNTASVKYKQSQRKLLSHTILSLLPLTYPKADAIVAVSQGVKQDLLNLIPGLVNNQIQVIYNPCLDSEVFQGIHQALPQDLLPQDNKLIVACGRLTKHKGFANLIDALVKVRKVIPAQLWIIGEGEERQNLNNKINSLGLNDVVHLLGFKQNPFQYMAAADVFVLSSTYEGFGNVIVEAMACGTPVVSTDCPYGPNEIIDPGVNGLLVPPSNPDKLAEAIIQVLTNPQLKTQLVHDGIKRSQDFDSQHIASLYTNLFLQLV